MKPLVIYHDNCADGFGASFAAWLKLGDEAEYLPVQYNNFSWPAVTDRDVYILDFSFPRGEMESTFVNAKSVVWLDHHKSAFEMWCGKYDKGINYTDTTFPHYLVLDDNKSGAMLAWEYFHPGAEIPMLFTHIDDYDRGQFKLAGTKEFNKALWSYAPWSFEQWQGFACMGGKHKDDALSALDSMSLQEFIMEGAAILRAHDQNVQSVVKGAARECVIVRYDEAGIDFMHMPGLAANCSYHLASDVGHALATQSGTFGLCWYLDKEGMIAKCSLRSNGDYDVSAIAKALGGGGHKTAAGFEVPVTTLLGWLG